MSVPAILPPVSEESINASRSKPQKPRNPSGNASTIYSKKTSKTTSSSRKKNDAEAKATKDRQEKLLELYDLWAQVKREERDEHHEFLKEKVSLQHSLIQQQDQLFKIKQSKIDRKQQQIKEAKRLTRLARTKHYHDFVREVLEEEKMKSRSLKSHTRVISSHQPVRIPQIVGSDSPTRSGETAPSYSRTSADGTIGESILLADNFSELINESVEVQLQALLGSDAESYLKPTFREGAKKSLDPLVYKHRGIGAHDLWGILRGKSQRKLERRDDMIPPDLKNAYRSFLRECVHADIPVFERGFTKDKDQIPEDQLSESHLIKDIHFSLHRLDLMFRVAHMNKDKTHLLFKTMESANPAEGTYRPPRYNPNQIYVPKVPTLAVTDFEHWTPFREEDTEEKDDDTFVLDGEKIKFLTEEMATCEGQFSARHNAPGTSKEPAPLTLPKHYGPTIRGTVSAPVTERDDRKKKKVSGKLWQPLSLNALLDYKTPVQLFGSGDFRGGQPKKWKLD